ncbi:MAG: amidohydrolase family protein, partial [Coriobacteriales bacterium]|nr:amidohydrolase family protein [Coriobacteriales bacterium]
MSKDNKADLLVLGNVITMDEHKPRAQAVAVKADKIVYVGSAEVAKTLCADTTTVLDFGANFVYPGFLEAHCHPTGAGGMITLAARMTPDDSPEECVQIMREFMDAHPNATLFRGMGFLERDTPVHARMLDAICPDKPMVITDCSGHNMWLNSCALEAFDIDREAIDLWGTDCVRVDEDGKPSGYLSEGPVFHVRSSIAHTLEELEGALLSWQDYALSRGFTGVYNAGVNLLGEVEQEAYHALEESGQLKHYVFAGYTIQDNTDTPERDIQEIAAKAAAYNSRHFELTGANISCDGTLETHTAWLANEYPDRPGYHGVTRFDDHDKIVRLVKAAAAAGLNVHVHTAGDAAVTTWVNGIAEAEEQTSNFDMRNALVHLQMA